MTLPKKKAVRSMSPLRGGRRSLRIASHLVANYLARSILPFGQGRTEIDQDDLDLDKVCRYPENPDVWLFRELIDREGMAQRCNDLYPDECFSVYPEVYQNEKEKVTRFETAWNDFADEMEPWHYLHRLDKLSGWGRYGVMLIGLSDGKDLSTPVSGFRRNGTRREDAPKLRVIYLKPFSEDLVTIDRFEDDRTSPRFGHPTMYTFKVTDPRNQQGGSSAVGGAGVGTVHDASNLIDVKVHWTRVLHVADNRTNCEWAGQPRLMPILNRIYDLRKILGSSAEMFFKGGFPGYTFAKYPELADNSEIDEESIREQLEDYMNGLKRYLASEGGEFKALAMQVADPANHVLQHVSSIAATMKAPIDILMGSQAGQLSSNMNTVLWNRRLAHRQRTYLNPMVIKPFIRRLMLYGALPRVGSFKIEWRDLNMMSDLDRAKVALTKSQAMMQYVSGKVETMLPLKQYLTFVMGMTDAEAEAIILARLETKEMMTEKAWDVKTVAKPQGGGRTGNAPARAVGRPGR